MDTYLRSKQPFTVKMSHLGLILPSSSGVSSSDSVFDKVRSSVPSTSEAPHLLEKQRSIRLRQTRDFHSLVKRSHTFIFFFLLCDTGRCTDLIRQEEEAASRPKQ